MKTGQSKTRRIGFAYDTPRNLKPDSADAISVEYEDRRTIAWLRRTLGELCEVVDLPWRTALASELSNYELDVIFNNTEGTGGRNRESLLPALAETQGVACTGSDSLAVGISLDKSLTKVLARHHGIPTPRFLKVSSPEQWRSQKRIEMGLTFPLIVKPNTGGSSLGIRKTGREMAAGFLQNSDGWTALPIAEIKVGQGEPDSFYSIEMKRIHKKQILCPADISPEELIRMLISKYAPEEV